jgi:hypothetical protein
MKTNEEMKKGCSVGKTAGHSGLMTCGEDVEGMFLCWVQVSRRMEKTLTLAEWRLKAWLLERVVHRTVTVSGWEASMEAIRERVCEANALKNPDDAPLNIVWSEPDEVSSGCIRIERDGDAKAVMNVPVIDWRGNLMPCSM